MILQTLLNPSFKTPLAHTPTQCILNSFSEFLEESHVPTLYLEDDAYIFAGRTRIKLTSKKEISTSSELILLIRNYDDVSESDIEILTNTAENLEKLVSLGGFSIERYKHDLTSITFENSQNSNKTKFTRHIPHFPLSEFEKIIYTQFFQREFEIQATDDIRYLERRLGNYVGNLLENQSLYK